VNCYYYRAKDVVCKLYRKKMLELKEISAIMKQFGVLGQLTTLAVGIGLFVSIPDFSLMLNITAVTATLWALWGTYHYRTCSEGTRQGFHSVVRIGMKGIGVPAYFISDSSGHPLVPSQVEATDFISMSDITRIEATLGSMKGALGSAEPSLRRNTPHIPGTMRRPTDVPRQRQRQFKK
jgi:hypothetical protein